MATSAYFIWFLLYSCMGWVWESIYAVARTGKWEDRGFLYGPICPIYGFCACLITFLANTLGLTEKGPKIVFLVAFFGSMVIEYFTSWALEKLFHAYWWDYSYMPFNLNGRICLPASTLFGFAGLGVLYGTAPRLQALTGSVNPLLNEAVGLLGMALAAADTALTVSALTSFRTRFEAINKGFNTHMEEVVDGLVEKQQITRYKLDQAKIRLNNEILESRERREEQREFLAQKREQQAEEYLRQMSSSFRHAVGRVEGFRDGRHIALTPAQSHMNRALKSMKQRKIQKNEQ